MQDVDSLSKKQRSHIGTLRVFEEVANPSSASGPEGGPGFGLPLERAFSDSRC